jgi:hypothetical protein
LAQLRRNFIEIFLCFDRAAEQKRSLRICLAAESTIAISAPRRESPAELGCRANTD